MGKDSQGSLYIIERDKGVKCHSYLYIESGEGEWEADRRDTHYTLLDNTETSLHCFKSIVHKEYFIVSITSFNIKYNI